MLRYVFMCRLLGYLRVPRTLNGPALSSVLSICPYLATRTARIELVVDIQSFRPQKRSSEQVVLMCKLNRANLRIHLPRGPRLSRRAVLSCNSSQQPTSPRVQTPTTRPLPHRQEASLHLAATIALTMSANSGLSEAPPTRKPSMSGIAERSGAFFALADPPY